MRAGTAEARELGSPPLERFHISWDEALIDFDHFEVLTRKTLDNGHSVPDLVDVHFPDQSAVREVSADTRVVVLEPTGIPYGSPIVVTLDRAAHVKHLHFDGSDSGSVFFKDATLLSVLRDVAEALPDEAVNTRYRSHAFNVDMQRDYGWENLIADWEAREQELITEHDYHLLNDFERQIIDANLTLGYKDKVEFAKMFNDAYPEAGIFLKVIRPPAGVIIPHIYGSAHLTRNVMVALSTRWSPLKGERRIKYLHTITPGRAMGRHPIPAEHMIGRGERVLNRKSFMTSAWNWAHHLLIVPPEESEESQEDDQEN